MKLITRLSLFVLLLVVAGNVSAQNKEKFGHIDSQKLLAVMPERAQAEKEIQAAVKQLEDELNAMMEEYERLTLEIQEKQDSLDEFILEKKLTELQKMAQSIEQYRYDAQVRAQQKQEEILTPIIEKAKLAIQEVAKENGYTYIFDTSVGVLLYFPETSDDILPLVKKKLGIE